MKVIGFICLVATLMLHTAFSGTLRFILIADPQMDFATNSPGLDRQYFEMTVDEPKKENGKLASAV